MTEPTRRVRRSPEQARRLILDTAQALIARTGPEGLRLQDIAAEAGISHSLILHHFTNRAGLVRALTQQASAELKDRLLAAMAQPESSPEDLLDRVFDAFAGGLAQRLAWLAVMDPDGGVEEPATMRHEIADTLYKRRLAAAPGRAITREDTQWLVHLVAVAAFGEALYGARLRRGANGGEAGARRFRTWFAALIREHNQGH
ncbi:MAG TPA: TetR/AcrR family transcriptional regulator [Stellaceae bacterium]|nr:TetR/AcrR family transcriptional regulator [Stellaceae bacterium]